MVTWTANLPQKNISVTTEQLEVFKRNYVTDADLLSRMSEVLWFDILIHSLEFNIDPTEILEAIHNVEAGEPHNGVKAATEFKKKPLKGLWHKHYFTARFLAQNMSLAWGKNGLQDIIEKVLDPKKYPVITEEAIEELAHAATHIPVEQRDADGKITGEWVIFAKNGGKNYYLKLAIHSTDDEITYNAIMEHCTRDFPDLKNWLPVI